MDNDNYNDEKIANEAKNKIYGMYTITFAIILLVFLIISSYGIYNFTITSKKTMDNPVYVMNQCGNINEEINGFINSINEYDSNDKETTIACINNFYNNVFDSCSNISTKVSSNATSIFKTYIGVLCRSLKEKIKNDELIDFNARELESNYFTFSTKIIKTANSITNSSMKDATAMSIIVSIFNIFISTSLLVSLILFQKKIVSKNIALANRTNLFNLLSSSLNFVCMIKTSPTGKMEYVSDNIEDILGFNHDIYFHDPSFYYPCFLDGSINKIMTGLSKTEKNEDYTTDVPIKNPITEEVRLFEYRVCKIYRGDSLIMLVTSLTDVTEIRQQKLHMAEALSKANEANIAKRNFLSNMSHEIRTPMNAICGITELAKRNIDNPEALTDYLHKIELSSNHLLRLLNDVLDMSKIESQKMVINKLPFDFKENMKQLINIVTSNCLENNQTFVITYENYIEKNILGDSLRINQILINLLSNASKFSPKGGEIALSINQKSISENMVELTFIVKDYGIGISQDFIDHIFLPFEQEYHDNGSKYRGTGLGLAITYNLVMAMNGRINVSSIKNEGTAFTVSIPFEIVPEEKISLENTKILVISNDIHKTSIIECLERLSAKYEYIDTNNYLYEQKDFDAILIDIDCDSTSIALAEQIKAKLNNRVLLVSSLDKFTIEKTTASIKADGYLLKPLYIKDVYDTITSSNFTVDTVELENYDFTGKRVLLVEDNELNLQIGTELLQTGNITVECATNGYIAYNMYEKSAINYYDVILLDIHMPIMNGIECARKIRLSNRIDHSSTVLIAMTADSFTEDVENFKNNGMNDHIAKPIDINVLFKTLKKYL